MCILLALLSLIAAFEYQPAGGKADAMLAGGAVADWRNLFAYNPALFAEGGRYQVGAAYSRPYGLHGVDWGRVCGVVARNRWAGGVSISSLSLDAYRETDLQLNLGVSPVAGMTVGLGIHWLAVGMGSHGADGVPAFDLGFAWSSGVFRLAAACSRVNVPRFDNGDELPWVLLVAASVEPVEALLLALDVRRVQSEESAAFGMEFRLIPPLHLRVGGGVRPLTYGAGLGINVGILTVDYSYRFHPQLKETHVIGMWASWR